MKSENVGNGGTAVDWRAVLVFVSIAFSSQCGAVSYTHLDVYKRQVQWFIHAFV